MEVIRFALGFRFDPLPDSWDGEGIAVSRLLAAIPLKLLEGMRLYMGHCPLDENDDEAILTVVFMGKGLKKTRALHEAVLKDPYTISLLTERKPFIQTNTVARLEGLTYYGIFDQNGKPTGGEAELKGPKKAEAEPSSRLFGKLIIAPDKFKGSFTQSEVIRAIKAAVRKRLPGVRPFGIPIADGGEGTARILAHSMGGVRREAEVTGPNGDALMAEYFLTRDGSCLIEMASASGLSLAKRPLDALSQTSAGTGELIKRALDSGVKRIVVALGGSASSDGGLGAAAALGVRFFDENGEELEPTAGNMIRVRSLDASAREELADCEFAALCDVDSPLTGETGAARRFSPQKGADEATVERLEEGLANLERIYDAFAGRKVCSESGAGAAGGMGAMLAALFGAKLLSGAKTVLAAQSFDEALDGAFALVTGEGRLDGTSGAKAVGTALAAAKERGVPAFVLAGSIGEGGEALASECGAGVILCSEQNGGSELMKLEAAADRLVDELIKMAMSEKTSRCAQRKSTVG